jgi:hypothetical protein
MSTMVRVASMVVARQGAIMEWEGASPIVLEWSCRSCGQPVCRHDTHVLLATPACGQQVVQHYKGRGVCVCVLLAFLSVLCLSVTGFLCSIDGLSLRMLTCFVSESASAVHIVCHWYHHLWVS